MVCAPAASHQLDFASASANLHAGLPAGARLGRQIFNCPPPCRSQPSALPSLSSSTSLWRHLPLSPSLPTIDRSGRPPRRRSSIRRPRLSAGGDLLVTLAAAFRQTPGRARRRPPRSWPRWRCGGSAPCVYDTFRRAFLVACRFPAASQRPYLPRGASSWRSTHQPTGRLGQRAFPPSASASSSPGSPARWSAWSRCSRRSAPDGDWIALAGDPRPRDRQPAPAEPPEQPAPVVGGRRGLARRGEGARPPNRRRARGRLHLRRRPERVAHRCARHADARRLGPARPAPVAPHAHRCSCSRRCSTRRCGGRRRSGRRRATRSSAARRASATAATSRPRRFDIWSNALALIASHPWLGVGFGDFNFAWTLTPFPGRPTEFFDHTHNLILNFAVEMGVPLATLVLGADGLRALAGARATRSPTAASRRRGATRSSAPPS